MLSGNSAIIKFSFSNLLEQSKQSVVKKNSLDTTASLKSMNRTTVLKFCYAAIIALVVPIVIVVWDILGGEPLTLLLMGAVLLIPGRLQGFFFRDLFVGRRLLEHGYLEEAAIHTERFLAVVRKHPWRNKLLWLAWSVYTTSAEAMALNNIGAARLGLGEFEAAKSALLAARAIDPKYPLPPFNLAILATIQGAPEAAEMLASEAFRLGYTGSSIDLVIGQAQSLLAAIEGRKRIQSEYRDD
jgi:tetratricopeptide (TPR) repeat protein